MNNQKGEKMDEVMKQASNTINLIDKVVNGDKGRFNSDISAPKEDDLKDKPKDIPFEEPSYYYGNPWNPSTNAWNPSMSACFSDPSAPYNAMYQKPFSGAFCPIPSETFKARDERLHKIKDILTVTEFEMLDIHHILDMDYDKFTRYISILNKLIENGVISKDDETNHIE
jgi:hypothetical protein